MLTLAYIDAGIVSKAVGKGNADVIQWLCETHNATINCRSGSGETPVYQAVYYGKDAVFDYLLEKDADVSVRENQSLIASVCSMQHAACSMQYYCSYCRCACREATLYFVLANAGAPHPSQEKAGWVGWLLRAVCVDVQLRAVCVDVRLCAVCVDVRSLPLSMTRMHRQRVGAFQGSYCARLYVHTHGCIQGPSENVEIFD